MPFIQVIEFSTTKLDELRKLLDELRSSPDRPPASVKGTLCADRDQPDRYLNIVEFESYEAAMENSNRPQTTEFAQRMAELCDGPPTFRNLDVMETFET